MSNQKKNDQARSPEPPRKQAGPIDDVEEGEERMEGEGGAEGGEGEAEGQPKSAPRSQSERPDSPASRWGSNREK